MPWVAAAAAAAAAASGGGGGRSKGGAAGDLEERLLAHDLERDGRPIYELPDDAWADARSDEDEDDLERVAATRELTPDEVQQLERMPADSLGDSFCRQRWAGPADQAGFEALSNHWLHMSISTIECGLLDKCPPPRLR